MLGCFAATTDNGTTKKPEDFTPKFAAARSLNELSSILNHFHEQTRI